MADTERSRPHQDRPAATTALTRTPPSVSPASEIPAPRRPGDDLDDADRLALLAANLMTDRLDRYGAVLGADVVLELAVATLQAQLSIASEHAWAAWVVRAAR